MCGIAGIFSRAETQLVASCLSEKLAHRGPDDMGTNALRDAIGQRAGTFVHRRLAILDVSSAGHQPMLSADEQLSITFNGEIYNFRALRDELVHQGVALRSQSDTEVILSGFALYGPAYFARLRGMFALGIWDGRLGRGYLARDPFGIKPLHVAQSGNDLIFASEVRSLLATGLIPRTLSREAIASYLRYGSISEPLTIVEGVRALPPGTCTEVTFTGERAVLGTPAVFARLPFSASGTSITERDTAARALRAALRDSVEHHLVSDVPIALFLSGGMDSAILAGLVQEVSGGACDSFTVSFAEHRFSEADDARRTAERFGTRHHDIALSGAGLLDMLPDAFASVDQPSMDGLNTYVISRSVQQAGFKVVLSGLGADELFGGYPSFVRARHARHIDRLPRRVREGAHRLASSVGHSSAEKLQMMFGDEEASWRSYRASRTLFGPRQLAALFGDTDEERPEQAPDSLSPLGKVSWYELRGYMLNTLLRDSDVFSMAHGLELRVPFIDTVVAETASRIADGLKVGPAVTAKRVLVDAVRDLLPAEMAKRRKQGFLLPFEDWLHGSMRDEVNDRLQPAQLERIGIDHSAGRSVWTSFLAGREGWSRPWALYTLARWSDENDVRVAPLSVTEMHRPSRPGSVARRAAQDAASRKRIHLWAPGVFDFKGGIQVYQRDLIAALRAVVPDTELRVLVKNDTGISPNGDPDLKGVVFQFAGGIKGSMRTLGYLQQIVARAVVERPALIIVGHVNFLRPARTLKQLFGIPYCVVAYGVEAWDVTRPTLRAALRDADLVLSISEHTRARLLREQPIVPERIVLLPPTFDACAFQPGPKPAALLERFGLRADQPVIVTVARLAGAERYKGYDRIVDALPAVRQVHPDVRYIVVGDGGDRARIERRIADLGLRDNVTLAGFVPDGERQDFYNLCDVFAMPSRAEGFGIVYIEAMACGKPTLGGNRDGAVDALAGGLLGALVDPDDPAAIARTLIQMLAGDHPAPLMYDPPRLRAEVIARFGVDRFRQRLSEHLERLLPVRQH